MIDDRDPLVLMMRDILEGRPVLTVYHAPDGEWQYISDGEAVAENGMVGHQSHLYDLDPSLRELQSMPVGTWATRSALGEPWVFGPIEEWT